MQPEYERYQIKSFKHNGHIHRIWFENWPVPDRLLLAGTCGGEHDHTDQRTNIDLGSGWQPMDEQGARAFLFLYRVNGTTSWRSWRRRRPITIAMSHRRHNQ